MTHLSPLVIVFLVIALAVAAAAATLGRGKKTAKIDVRPRALMTKREQAMYWRLRETLPDAVVLAQVSFSSLITSAFKQRGHYDRKTADFVVCDRSIGVQAVIELDDASHKGREVQDKARDGLLAAAGYTTLRFANVPDVQELKERLESITTQVAAPAPKRARARSPAAVS